MKYLLYFFVFFFIPAHITHAHNANTYGLKFKSYDAQVNDRTGLILDNGNYIDIDKEFTLDFDIKYREGEPYGSIVRIINPYSSFLSLQLSISESDNYPVFIINREITPINTKITYNEWQNISITISNIQQTITLKYENFAKTFDMKKEDWEKVRICFGKCPFPELFTEEVPPISIRNVKIIRNNHLIREWLLNTHADTICYDVIKQEKAIVINPEWIIDSYAEWKEVASYSFYNENKTQYTFNNIKNILYIIPDEKSIIAYNFNTGKENVINVKEGLPAACNTNQLIFNSNTNELLSYNLEKQLTSNFSFENESWNQNQTVDYTPGYWHHTANYWQSGSALITFGGYGFHRYNNQLIKFTQKGSLWENHVMAAISPRYSAASTIVNDSLFIFSGEGNKFGKQEITTNITTDLYAIDLKTNEAALLWEMPNDLYGLPCGNMVYDPESDCFYVLAYYKNTKQTVLLKINKNNPEIEILPSIPSVELDSNYNFHTLMKADATNEMYAFFCRNYNAGDSKIDIYKIAYPPIAKDNVYQQPAINKGIFSKTVFIVIIIVICCIVLSIIFYYLLRKRKEKTANTNTLIPELTEKENINNPKNTYFDRTVKSISLLGAFNVKDIFGNDITNQFTPILKNIILAVILNSNNKAPGIISRVIDNLIWPDKDEKAARNNRNVSMNRLNIILEKIGDVQVYNDNNFWKITMKDDTFCDYLYISRFLKINKQQIFENEEQKSQLLELLSFGPLLPFTKDEWLNPYKVSYTHFALDFLLGILSQEETQKDIESVSQITNLIFLFDSLNEEALCVKCRLFYKQGKKSLLKSTYNNFCKEYENLLGEKYLIPLQKILNYDR